MTNKQPRERTFLNVFTPLGKKVKNLVLGLATTSVILIVIDFSLLRRKCDINDNFTSCKVSTVASNLYSSFITSIITIVGIELILQDDMLKKIKEIFQQNQVNYYLKSFYLEKKDYKNQILDSFRQLESDEEIKFLCLAESLNYLNDDLGIELLIKKLSSNCKIVITVIHPESSLLTAINHPQNQIAAEDLNRDIERFMKKVRRNIPSRVNGKGSLIIKRYKSFSSIGYISSPKFNLAWLYLSDEIEVKSPAFEFIERSIISKFENHLNSTLFHAETYYSYRNGIIKDPFNKKL